MKKLLSLFALSTLFAVVLFASLSSAYSDYSHSYFEKRSIGPSGYQYVQKEVSETPYGESVRYTKISDAGYDPYVNRVSNYWSYGPNPGYTVTKYHRNNRYSDVYNRGYYGSQYHDYYYQPRWNGDYWDWSSSAYSRCSSVLSNC